MLGGAYVYADGFVLSVSSASGSAGDTVTEVTETEIKTESASDAALSVLQDDTQELTLSVDFKDIGAYDWAAKAINGLAAEGIIKGTGADTFSPAVPVTRAMFVTLLYRIAGEPAVRVNEAFDDVTEGAYYYAAVNWAEQNGIVSGMGGSLFNPDSNITREQAMTILKRYLTYAHAEYSLTLEYRVFIDDDEISDWAKDAVQHMNKLNIINGKGEGRIDPQGSTTRAEAAVMLDRLVVKSDELGAAYDKPSFGLKDQLSDEEIKEQQERQSALNAIYIEIEESMKLSGYNATYVPYYAGAYIEDGRILVVCVTSEGAIPAVVEENVSYKVVKNSYNDLAAIKTSLGKQYEKYYPLYDGTDSDEEHLLKSLVGFGFDVKLNNLTVEIVDVTDEKIACFYKLFGENDILVFKNVGGLVKFL
jgi:hypothetical protein